ncbi:M23 family metallopeptidase [Gracilimonas mengyeensis]|uniref:Murein DD-endopeptidase MepM and murein hydrolase activator NlpD, contain LysM domain n=1 Tax=Gracilimonas mengyeensis TaxID=1302730 RepID=A0A521FDR9_9BACT|nr:M23 family metallopeptidase [Gracilimonas mengyeensis]SMO94144.1 Murein DD-endopeptidase MepM and murein hydrolase activator NlpD, contain LysM domain [Gracilimonas mengyeensis]
MPKSIYKYSYLLAAFCKKYIGVWYLQKLSLVAFMLMPLMLFQGNEPVSVFKVEGEDEIYVYVRNRHIYPITIEVQFELENLTSQDQFPFNGVIDANDQQKIATLSYQNKSESWKYGSRYRYFMGDIHAKHDSFYAYRLPFKKGLAYRVNQGYNSTFTHKDNLSYSLDFDMPEGGEVYAARDGLVVEFEESNNLGGPLDKYMDKANYLTIMHSDGTFADYIHLKKDGVLVETGQEIRRGQLIGYSGNTGFTTGPHLHFTVKKTKQGGGFVSLPVRFHTIDGVMKLEEGALYTAY